MPGVNAYEIFGEIKADTRDFQQKLKDADSRLRELYVGIDKTEKKATDVGKTTATTARQFEKLADKVGETDKELRKAASAFEKGEISAKQFDAAVNKAERNLNSLDSKLKDTNAHLTDFASGQTALQKVLDAASGSGLGFAAQLGSIATGAGAVATGVSQAIGTVTNFAQAAFGGAKAIFDFVKSASDFGSEIKDFQDKTGLAANTIQTLKFNAEQSGIAFESLAAPLNKFTRLLYEASQGSEKATETLQKFGITDFNNLDGSLEQAIAKIHEAGSETEKSGIAMELFGAKSGTVMRAVADNVDGNLGAAIKRAEELGLTLSQDDVNAADKFGDALGLLGRQAQSLGARFALQLAPDISSAMDSISQKLAQNQDDIRAWGNTFANVAVGVVASFAGIIDKLNEYSRLTRAVLAVGTLGGSELFRATWNAFGETGKTVRENMPAPRTQPSSQYDPTTGRMISTATKRIIPKFEDDSAISKMSGGGNSRSSGKIDANGGVKLSAQAQALVKAANKLGVSPIDLAAIIGYETAGTFSPTIKGGKDGNYQGLIQFGPEERARYNVDKNKGFEAQLMGSVVPFLQDRFRIVGRSTQGATVSDLYRAINGGSPKAPLSASDGNGTIGEHVVKIVREQVPAVIKRFFGGPSNVAKLLGADVASGVKTITDELAGMDSVFRSMGLVKDVPAIDKLTDFIKNAPADTIRAAAESLGLTVEQLKQFAANAQASAEQTRALTDALKANKAEREANPLGGGRGTGTGTGLSVMNSVDSGDENSPSVKPATWLNMMLVNLKKLKDETKSFKDAFQDNVITAIGSISDIFANAVTSGRDFFSTLKDGFKSLVLQIVGDLTRLASNKLLTGIFGKIFGGLSGAGASGPGLMGSVAGSGGGLGGLSGGIGGLIGKAGGWLGGLLGIGGGAAGGTAGAAAGTGAAGAAAGGGGLMASMGALLTNPWTAVIAGGIIGGVLLWKHFNSIEKKLKKAAQSMYGVTPDDGVIKQLKQLKKAMGYKSAEETVASEMGRDLIEQFAASSGQKLKGENKPTAEQLGSETWSGNQFSSAFSGFDSARAAAVATARMPNNPVMNDLVTAIGTLLAQTGESLDAFREKFAAVSPDALIMAQSRTVADAVLQEAANGNFGETLDRRQGVYI